MAKRKGKTKGSAKHTNGAGRTLLVKVTDATLAKVHAMAAASGQTLPVFMSVLIAREFGERWESLENQAAMLEQQAERMRQSIAAATH